MKAFTIHSGEVFAVEAMPARRRSSCQRKNPLCRSAYGPDVYVSLDESCPFLALGGETCSA